MPGGPTLGTWVKALAGGAAMCIGGPALVMYVSPTEEELFKKYNPELQARSLENREKKQQDFDDFVCNLKEASKSKKPIWAALKDLDEKRADEKSERLRAEQHALQTEKERRAAEIKSSAE